MATLRAIRDRFIVKREAPKQVFHGKLQVPSHLHARQRAGQVVSAGPDSGVKVGETVVFSAMSGTIIESDDGEDVIVLRPSELLGTLKDG